MPMTPGTFEHPAPLIDWCTEIANDGATVIAACDKPYLTERYTAAVAWVSADLQLIREVSNGAS